jgi:hypothetical protein
MQYVATRRLAGPVIHRCLTSWAGVRATARAGPTRVSDYLAGRSAVWTRWLTWLKSSSAF